METETKKAIGKPSWYNLYPAIMDWSQLLKYEYHIDDSNEDVLKEIQNDVDYSKEFLDKAEAALRKKLVETFIDYDHSIERYHNSYRQALKNKPPFLVTYQPPKFTIGLFPLKFDPGYGDRLHCTGLKEGDFYITWSTLIMLRPNILTEVILTFNKIKRVSPNSNYKTTVYLTHNSMIIQ